MTRSGVFTVNFQHTSRLFLVFVLLTLNRQKVLEEVFIIFLSMTKGRGRSYLNTLF